LDHPEPTFKYIYNFLDKILCKKPTNHDRFGPWANELCAHLPKTLLKKLRKNYDKKFVDQS
jgi:hypothetical protein